MLRTRLRTGRSPVFSHAPCTGGGSAPGGIRYAAHLVFTDHSYEHVDVCEDCLTAIDGDDRADRMTVIVQHYEQRRTAFPDWTSR